MTFTSEQLQIVRNSQDEKIRVEALRQLLGYPVKELDREGSRFWYLRPGNDEEEAAETCPIAVGFCEELVSLSELEAKRFFTEEAQQKDIYGHYISRVAEEQPVMYLILPNGSSGRISLILPGEGKLRQQQIQTFSYDDEQLLSRLKRITQDEIFIATKALMSVPLVEWVFYEPIKTAKELALKLAQAARQIEQVIPIAYKQEREDGYLHTLLKSFQRELLPSLKLSSDHEKDYSFADIYAQTIAYALFTARVFGYVRDKRAGRTQENLFDRESAWQQLPETNPFLRKLFQDVSERSAEKLGDDLIGAISDIFVILRTTKMDAILSDFEMKMNREDIVIRFYEDFLAAYKPQMRERRGVYYTPEPVVSYMVRSVDILVKEKFNKPLGLADPEVMILDPACGTGTFLLWICQLIYQRFQESPAALTEGLVDKSWSGYVEERLLPRIFGFELLMSPYAIAHLKIGLFLQETGYKFDGGKRLGVYLINTLEDITLREETQQLSLNIPQMEQLIAEEAKAGARVKKEEPIMVVIGNPPYSGHSENNNPWIKELVNHYYFVDGKPLGEKNPKWLQDDYVKFIRFAQWRIDKSGQGVLAFISNHGFLDNPTFRGMRQHLIDSFNGIYIYDLHGNSKKKESDIDGGKDENVFDIQQGVTISLAIKAEDKYINHSHLYGLREYKYNTLTENTVNTTKFSEVKPKSEFYLLIPQNTDLFTEYEQFLKITDIMTVNGVGITTARDHVVIDFEKEPILDRATIFRDSKNLDEEVCHQLNIPLKKGWNLQKARESIKKEDNLKEHIKPVLYRPFDNRYIFYHDSLVWRTVKKVMKNILFSENLALITCRQQSQKNCWNLCSVSTEIIESCVISNKTKEINYLLPLYLYPDTNQPQELQQKKRPNFSEEFLKKIEINLGYLPTPETIFYYIYAIFHSPTYRTRYAEFLKIDFPRVPLTRNNNLFCQLAECGEQLVALHLMKSPKLNNLITQFTPNGGNQIVDAGHPKYTQNAVVINKKGDKFVGVPEEVWNFYIGGYQVCQKWLKDRKGRTLTDDDIQHYQRVVIALQQTIKLMRSIDQTIPNWPIE
ncbi:type ISP restriction/modification enzyme [Cylindrospermopsis raciborskii]|uniref:site-specific DNA-methyltransferase (adenine-specific) n=2 Tax=Cylindrospermopsis raciborskii TaxID=77022 RepID=A0A9Q5W8L5_9CYAN|nr:type ISP restriction/modification enzyme [Cylindrospermopsis raciborskii]OHY35542.1 DNA methyltransferase [Cylindrospermopsis raciborskii MVCC14]OPH09325.1 DNA methyltransferase [Cylindrospermopsis raciborskii CENA302]